MDRNNVETFYPVSPLQQGFIFHSMLEPDSGAYVLQLSFAMQGSLNISTFEQAWQRVIDRHAVFRTSFLVEGTKEFVQVVQKKIKAPLTLHDWRGLSEAEALERFQAYREEDRKKGFVLDEAPLMRLMLFQVSSDTYYFLWSCHHLLMDGWSMPLVVSEFFATFDALCNGRPVELPPVRPYRDYIVWLRKQNMRKAEHFWRRKMKGFQTPTLLPMDRMAEETTPNGKNFGEELIFLRSDLSEELKNYTRKNKLTISTLIQGAWAYLLSRYNDEEDVVFGATGSGRPADLPGVETMIGMFINTLPVRVQVPEEVTVLDWLSRLQGEFAELREYEYCPLVQIQGWSEVKGGEHLFDSIVVYENYPVSSDAANEMNLAVQIREVEAEEQTNYPLTLVAAPGEKMALRLLYDRKRFDRETVNRLLHQVGLVIEQMVASPEKQLVELSLLTEEDRDLILRDWNETKVDQALNQPVQHLFAEQAAKTPDALAVVKAGVSLTYQKLDELSNRLAHVLLQQGDLKGRLVGVCMERSPELLVAILGILKAGAAYVPIDPVYPQDRIAYIMEDSQIQSLLTQTHLRAEMPTLGAEIIEIDPAWNALTPASQEPLTQAGSCDDRAYVIYTSGSTGLPKGVEVAQRSLLNLVAWHQQAYGVTEQDKASMLAGTAFDASVWEIWPYLTRGACLFIPDEETRLMPAKLQQWFLKSEITISFMPTSLVEHFLVLDWPEQTRLRYLLTGGDKLHHHPSLQVPFTLVNHYGPTENTVVTTAGVVKAMPHRHASEQKVRVPSLGRPIANTEVYILDKHKQSVPVGMTGELYIGGAGLAKGYLHRPELTAERFVPHPFSTEPGAKLYRSGDLVRYLPNGEIEFIGRTDNQVKIRGFRIELGEIESVLEQHPSVELSVVVVFEDEAQGKQLVAYGIPEKGYNLDSHVLSQFLRSKLPEYMVPSAFVQLEELPLTANGKIDFRALPAPDTNQFVTEAYVAPRNPVEEMVANVFAHLLRVEKVGVHDNFFSLGGHSLLATQAISRLRESFDLDLPLRALFECPTVEEMAEKIELERTRGESLLLSPILPVSREQDQDAYPISFAQQRLWFYDRLMPGTALYNIPSFLQIKGPLQIDLLQSALFRVAERHEVLRTTFADVDGEAIQVIAAPQAIDMPMIDLRALPVEQKQAELRVLGDQEVATPFDLQKGPLLRVRLVQMNDEDFVLLLSMHHIISDGWSMGIFINELFTIYNALNKGEEANLPPLAIQYADFSVWQRETLQGEVLDAQLSYWKEKLAGSEPLLKLPTDRPRPVTPTNKGDQFTIALPSELLAQLNELSQAEGTTLFMTLLAAFQVLLYRYSGQHDVTVGTPVAGRNRQDLEGLIGFFVNMLALRTDLSGNPTFRELLARVRSVALGAYDHQDVPFEKIVDEVVQERSLSFTPLFQTLFVLQNLVSDAIPLEGLSVASCSLSEEVMAKFDLTLSAAEGPGVLNLTFEYSTDLFDRDTILRMSERFVQLLENIVENPKQEIDTLAFLTPAEQKILREWNNTKSEYPREVCIHQQFEQQVQQAPDAIAVEFAGEWITYAELDRRANQLAHYLQARGVKTESLVGICVERSVEMIVSILAVMKAGGAYVPLDPAYPAERLAYMVEDSRLAVLLTQQHLLEKMPAHQAITICLDTDASEIALEATDAVQSGVRADNLAYVIYTSGSTGRPKGVMVEHASISNTAQALIRAFEITPTSRVLQFTSFSFDVSISEITMTLLSGATLVMETRDRLLPSPDFVDLLEERRITALSIPSSILGALPEKPLPLLTTLIVGGDVCTSELVSRWGKGRKLFNCYGPTEATVTTTLIECEDNGQNPPIGRPIANAQVYLLDANLEPVPIGVPGELYIGGDGLARGYLHRPDLTVERFVAHPFERGGRLYRTGDLARFLPDGNLEFLGRVDEQVKIRGFRIELGEIETVLLQHQAVKEVAVMAREDEPNIKRLVAYVVAEESQTVSAQELRNFVKEQLPDYMVPAYFVMLERLPLGQTGKLDKKALPAPDRHAHGQEEGYVAPRTPQEIQLAEIWKKVLGLSEIGVHDNFFERGGDSILSIQIVSRANQAGLRLTPKLLFEHQTIAELAQVVGEAKAVHAEQGIVTGEVPLLPIQNWFFEQNFKTPQHWNQATMLTVRQDVTADVLEQAVAHLLTHHDAFRLRYHQTEAGEWKQIGYDVDDNIPFESVDLSALPEAEQTGRIEALAEEAQRSLNITEGPLLRAVHFHLGAEKAGRLLIVVHHLAMDGVSWRIVLEDLPSICERLLAGQPVVLPPKTTSYKHWAEQLAAYAKSEELAKESAYWLHQSQAEAAVLPVENADGDNSMQAMNSVVVSLTAEETSLLLRDVQATSRMRVQEVLLTALAMTALRWTGGKRLRVNLEGHGREEILEGVDLSRTIGWFTSMYPVLFDLQDAKTTGDALKAVKEQLRSIPNKGIGYGLLRYLSGQSRFQSEQEAQIAFNYLGQLDQMVAGEDPMFGLAPESTGASQSPDSSRAHLLELSAVIMGGQLHVTWMYSREQFAASTIEQVTKGYLEMLRECIQCGKDPDAVLMTPSDFPLAKLSQSQLDAFIGENHRNVEDVYLLSPLQEGLLFHSRLSEGEGDYHSQLAFTFQGEFDVQAFERAWQLVSDRHSIFRTTFLTQGVEQPHQIVWKRVPTTVVQEDWRHLIPEEQEAQMERFLAEDRANPFDFSQVPMRLYLLQGDENSYHFVWSHHHALLDGWSLPLVLKDLFTFYTALLLGEQPEAGKTRPFRDYIAWLERQNLQEAQDFWTRTLQGFTAPTPLALGKQTPSDADAAHGGYGRKLLMIPEEQTTALQAFARQNQMTLNTLVQGAWSLLLSRYSGEHDVVFGTTVSGRPADLPDVESMVGLFINTLPVRVQVATEDSALAWLKELQNKQTELRQYEFSPLVEVQGWSDVARGVPLFESLLVFENYPVDEAIAEREEESTLSIHNIKGVEQTNYPITLVVGPGRQMQLKLMYDADRFAEAEIEHVLAHLQTVLEAIVNDPAQRVQDLSMLTEAEAHQLLVEWNDTATDYPREKAIHQLFEEQALAAPERIALQFGKESMTYGELNARANRLAHYLQAQGVQADDLVGLCMERSLEMFVSLLGILKAGGAYVPIDPNYPEERLTYMLEDSKVQVLLTQAHLASKLPPHQATVVVVDANWAEIAKSSAENPVSGANAESLAYVIYTSGSTGLPKGVLVPHRAVVRLVQNTNFADFSAENVSLQAATISFDAATFEIWGALLHGARLVVMQPFTPTPAELGATIQRYGVTTMWLTVGLFNLMVEENLSALQGVKQLLVGGDALSVPHIRKAFALEGTQLINGYGPTESTTFTCCHLIREQDLNGNSIPIGRPIANTTVYVLDEHQNPVPVGVPGELYIGGDGLARGYLNRPDLTEKSFVPNPFAKGEADARLYRTGDLVRYLPDGNIEFIGRIDNQVKIRGFRIELGEIEAVLEQQDTVRTAVVLAREDVTGGKRLVAYVVADETFALTEAEEKEFSRTLRQSVRSKLPDYMVPSLFIKLDSLPLTANGKVDKKALPAPDPALWQSEHEYVAPRTPAEEMVANIWAQLLHLKKVGADDNFFDIGGHSLLATQAVSRLREAFGVELPLRTLFDRPTVAELAAHLQQLKVQGGLQAEPLVPVERENLTPPLSFAQQRLWFLDRLLPNGALYNIPLFLRIEGEVQVSLFEQSLNALIERHETLRTTFAEKDGQAVQVIAPSLTISLPIFDLTHLTEEEQQAEVRRLAEEETLRPFDLGQGPLIRGSLVQLCEGSVLLMNMHHIISDGWSMGVFLRELVTSYNALCQGEEIALPDLPIQYADFAIWQRNWLQGDVLEEQLSYWKKQLSGAEPLLQLPTDRPRPAVQTHTGAMYTIDLSPELTEKLNELSRAEGATLFITLLAAYQTLLYRYTGQEDILVGSPIANRNRQEIEGLIGFFVNTLVFRTAFDGDMRFADLIAKVRETALGAYAHQDLPFEKIVDELQLERSLSYSPLFQVLFALQNAPVEVQELEGLTLRPFETSDQVLAKFDLTLNMQEAAGSLHAMFEYNTDLFDRETIARMAGQFVRLLEGIVENPQQPVGALPLFTEAEREQLLVQWNDTKTDYPRDKTIDQLFEEQAEATPDAIALLMGDASLTYGELNSRANQLAHYLKAQGVGSESMVGLCVERSFEMIVGMLGILKTGAAYVPLDPAYPQERLAYMLEDTKASLLVTLEHLVEKLPHEGLPTVRLDADWNTIAQCHSENLSSSAKATDIAYVIYTSGSTGLPKGVCVPHRGPVRLVKETKYFAFSNDQVFLQASAFSFDASAFEIWGSLLNGSRLAILPPHLPALEEIAEAIERYGVTTMWLTVGLFNLMADHCLEALGHVKHIFVGGDVVSVPHARKVLELGTVRLYNGYGPTESSTFTTSYPITLADCDRATLPIGRPISNTQVYILDAQMQPVPVGVPGELYIGGDGLANGYWNREDLTAERFLPHPFAKEAGARLYKTGDLVRYLPDGNIEYIGRIDNQVKIRGFRIELGEIEAALAKHTAVKDATVFVHTAESGEKRLVVYYVLEQAETAESIDTSDVRRFLKETLPDYMMPSFLIPVDHMPLTPNGKVDRKALPAPDLSSIETEKEYQAPRTEQEQKLADIWQQVLGRERVGVHDNFFALGGDSILSIQIVSRANQAGLRLTPKQMFEYQTIAELAEAIEQAGDNVVEIVAEQGIVTGELPLLPIQQWFFAQEFANQHHWNQSMLLNVSPAVDPALLQQAVQQLLAHHDALRLRFEQATDGWKQVNVDLDDVVPFEIVDLSATPESEQAAQIEAVSEQAQQSLNLTAGPLMRAVYMNLGAEKQGRLLLVVHHLAVDGVSWRVLFEDLQTAYEQLLRGEQTQLPPKTTSYKHWAEQLAAHAKSETLEQELPYWLAQVADEHAPIPVDHPNGANTEASMESITLALSAEETRALLQEVPSAYHTQINDVLLTALVQATAPWTEKQTLLVNLEGHGREEILEGIDLSRTVGWFTTMYPVLLDVREAGTIADALKSVKEQLRRIPNKGIGYGLLRYLSDRRETLSQHPHAEISFNYLGQFDQMVSSAEEALFSMAGEARGRNSSQDAHRSHLLDVTGAITGGQLHMTWLYSREVHERQTMEGFAERYMAALRALIAHCQSPEAFGFTPSDFPLAKLNQQQLDRLLAANRAIENIYPISPLQQGMLFHSIYAETAGDYVVQIALTFEGDFDAAKFEQAWRQTADRHAILRTSFAWQGLKEPHQIVHSQANFAWELHDWRTLTAEEQAERLQTFLLEDRMRGFDFAKPPMRFSLVRLTDDAYRFVWSHHHVLLDGWSLPLVLTDVFAYYNGLCQGQTVTLGANPPFARYIEWLLRQDLKKAERFWREMLQGFTAPTPVGNSVNKALLTEADMEKQYAQQLVHLSAEQTQALQDFARKNQLTLNTIVQGAWALLLSRYSGEKDVVYGVTGAGRPADLPGVEQMVGLFINTLPLRVQVETEDHVQQWLKRLQDLQAEIRQYEYSPLVNVQGWSEVPHGTPLFESLYVFENYPVAEGTAEGGASSDLAIRDFSGVEQTNYPITLVAAPGTELMLRFMYDRNRFDDRAVERILGHLTMLLSGITAENNPMLRDLPLLTESERNQLLYTWNETTTDYPRDLLIHQVYEEQAQETPDAIAVLFGDESMTYGELNARANQLAHYLQKRGIGAGSHVGICTERSLEMVVSMLGVLKAGAAYVPLDLTYPIDRLNFMTEDANVSLLLALEHWTDQLPQTVAERIFLDSDWEVIAQESTENLPSQGTSDDTAYLIYTSGSTGKPKGVCVPHRGCVRLVKNTNYFEFRKDQVFLNATTISFDTSVFEIWGSLLNGASLALLPPQTTDVEMIGQAIEKFGVTTMWLTVGVFNLMADNCLESLRGMEHIIVGGDVVSVPHARKVLQLGTVKLINGYGPTESSTFATSHPITMEDCKRASLPIGRPIANTTVYILDEQMQPVPIGVPGELYLGGDGVATGYLNRPELTAERFVPNPFSDEPNATLYKTGDLVRYMTDGNIEFMGRLDNQVKIRGFRIELGEVEAALAQHSAIQEAIAIVREDVPGDKRIVAYQILDADIPCTHSDLRQFLSEKLPHYMVPSAFVTIEKMPLTPNGKIDRKALPKPDFTQGEPERVYVAPRTDLERRIHDAWSQVLGAETIGVYDNFFDVGGQSLLATQLIFRLREDFEVEIPLRVLFEKPTIAGMAEMLEQIQTEGVAAAAEAVDTKDLRAEVVLDEAIRPATPYVATERSVSAFQKALLTGATGFLGAFLLQELLDQTDADIYCLIRAKDAEKGMQRIRENLERYELWNDAQQDRIIPVVGDFAKPLLGLTNEDFHALAKEIDVIYHNGALVNTVYPYAACKAANVLGTEEILRLASLYQVKPVHFVSTLSVFPAPQGTETKIATEDEMSSCDGLMMGYAQSKWVAEQLMDVARKRGIPTTIYRCGRISGHSKTGACQTDDLMWRIVKGCIQLGLAPDMQTEMEMSPVDYICRSIVHLSRDESSFGRNFHLLNAKSPAFGQFVQAMQELGYPVRVVSVPEWMTALQEEAKQSTDNAAAPLGNVLMETRTGQLIMSGEKTQKRLEEGGVFCPTVDAKLLKTIMTYFMKIGFLENPDVTQQ